MSVITQEIYDNILDELDNQNIEELQRLFLEYNIKLTSELYDAPREGNNGSLIISYLDYILSYNLVKVVDFLIDVVGLIIDDSIIERTLELQSMDTFNYILSLGYIPSILSLKYAVQNCYSEIVDKILSLDNELVHDLEDEDIEYLFNYDITDETLETIRVLFNYNINAELFTRFYKALKDPEDRYFEITDEEQDFAIELIDLLSNKCNLDE